MRNGAAVQAIVKRRSTCDTITADILSIIEKRCPVDPLQYNEHLEKERVRSILNKKENASILRDSVTETDILSTSEFIKDADSQSSHGSSKVDAEAELAAKKAEMQALNDVQVQEEKLSRMQAEVKRQEALMEEEIEAEKRKLQQIKTERMLKVAAARARVYAEADITEEPAFQQTAMASAKSDKNATNCDNQNAGVFDNTRTAVNFNQEQERYADTNGHFAKYAADVLKDSLQVNRLPIPEPSVFTGDALLYTNWKISFQTLIEDKGLTSAEKLFYLRRYLGGPALRAVEGFFFSTSEEAYVGAWKLLNGRYGHPFHIQEAFREKLGNWPKIKPKDGPALQEFADFLRACNNAVTQVPGLGILSDCKENQRLTTKLLEWLASRWNCIVTRALEEDTQYPTFVEFVKFVSTEARIACNPITSFGALKISDPENQKIEVPNNRAKGVVLATTSGWTQAHERKGTSITQR